MPRGQEERRKKALRISGLLTAGVESLLEDKLADAETNGSSPGALPGSPKVTVDDTETSQYAI